MKKQTLLFFSLLLGLTQINAQDIQLYYKNTPLYEGQVIQIENNEYTSELQAPIEFKNTTNKTLNIKVCKIEEDILAGTENTFCFVNCYDSSVDTSFAWVITEAGEWGTKANFDATYYPNKQRGISLIKYVFFDKNDPSIKSSVQVLFSTQTSSTKPIEEDIIQASIANKTLSLSSTVAQELDYKIYSIQGNLLMKGSFRGSEKKDLSFLSNGVYIIEVYSAFQSILKKKFIL